MLISPFPLLPALFEDELLDLARRGEWELVDPVPDGGGFLGAEVLSEVVVALLSRSY